MDFCSLILLLQTRFNYRVLGRLNNSWNVILDAPFFYSVTFVISLVSIHLFLCCSLIYSVDMKLNTYELLTWRLGLCLSCICAPRGKLLTWRTMLDCRLLSLCRFWTPLVCIDSSDGAVLECALCLLLHGTHTFARDPCQLILWWCQFWPFGTVVVSVLTDHIVCWVLKVASHCLPGIFLLHTLLCFFSWAF